MIDFGARTIEFDDEDRFDVERITRMDEFLGRMDRKPVHHLDAGGNDPGRDDAADAGAGLLRGGEAGEQSARAFGLGEKPHRDLGDDAEQALGAVDDAEQIVAAGIEMLAAEAHDLAGHQHESRSRARCWPSFRI